ncbi:hypothetical protein CVIRNUC_009304 [Coccomyxa viridis]|uniref:Uncharacterized protein n=1 Tax=Coccomyxa viridis TaxID=1274662 RepID=A0AAV1IFG7_9CHLO|nr:hypothetical protein CVIRNUC_009304 [Coccomyxa viridis]
MAGKGVKVFRAGGSQNRKVTVNSASTKQLNHRRVFVAKKDITLNARFSMLSTMRQHASQRQSEGRDSLLAQKRGWQAPPVQKSSQGKGGIGKVGGKKGKRTRKKGIAVGVGPKVRPTAVDRTKSKQTGKRRGGQ